MKERIIKLLCLYIYIFKPFEAGCQRAVNVKSPECNYSSSTETLNQSQITIKPQNYEGQQKKTKNWFSTLNPSLLPSPLPPDALLIPT